MGYRVRIKKFFQIKVDVLDLVTRIAAFLFVIHIIYHKGNVHNMRPIYFTNYIRETAYRPDGGLLLEILSAAGIYTAFHRSPIKRDSP